MRVVGEQREELPFKYRKGFDSWKKNLGKKQEQEEMEVINKAIANPGTPFILLELGPQDDYSAQGIAAAIMDKQRPPFDQTPGQWYSVADRLGSSPSSRVWIVWMEG